MTVKVKAGVLADALALAGRVATKKDTIPVLQCARLSPVSPGLFRLEATDLDVWIATELATETEEQKGMNRKKKSAPDDDTALLLPVRRLGELARQFQADAEVVVVGADRSLEVSCGDYRGKLQVPDVSDFPQFPSRPAADGAARLPALALRTAIAQTRFAATADDRRYMIDGVSVLVKNGTLFAMASDTHRLAVSRAAAPGAADMAVFIASRAVAELVGLLDGADSDAVLCEDEDRIFASVGPCELVARKTSGKFPDVLSIMARFESKVDREALVDRSVLGAATRRSALVADKASISMAVSTGMLTLSGRGAQVGESDERVACEYSGPDSAVSFRPTYLQQFLDAAVTDRVRLSLTSDMSALIWRQDDLSGAGYDYLLMPIVPPKEGA